MIRVTRMLAAPVVAAALLLSACTQSPAPTPPTPAAESASPDAATPSAEPAVAAVDPGGTASDNLPVFQAAAAAVVAADPNAQGRDLVDALVAAGFPKEHMEVTADRTPLGNSVDSILVSVHMADACLIGQRAQDGFSAQAEPALASGRCLVGQTRAIDW